MLMVIIEFFDKLSLFLTLFFSLTLACSLFRSHWYVKWTEVSVEKCNRNTGFHRLYIIHFDFRLTIYILPSQIECITDAYLFHFVMFSIFNALKLRINHLKWFNFSLEMVMSWPFVFRNDRNACWKSIFVLKAIVFEVLDISAVALSSSDFDKNYCVFCFDCYLNVCNVD